MNITTITDGQIALISFWGFFGIILYLTTFQEINSKVKLPIWALICGPFVTIGTVIYWFIWSLHFVFFKKDNVRK